MTNYFDNNRQKHNILMLVAIHFIFILFFSSCSKEEYFVEQNIDDTVEQVEEEEEEVLEEDEAENTDPETEEENTGGDVILDTNFSSVLKAFPTAEGAGAFTSGGRGGRILHVTTLEDGNFEGTFRWALNQTYPRIVVFDVSGTIILNDYLFLDKSHSNLTIAGQTAPEGGITIQGPTIGFWKMDNVIMRYIRVVNTSYFDKGEKGAAFSGSGCNNLIVDHCSFRYVVGTSCVAFQDDNDQADGQGDITIQRSIIGDATTGMLIGAIATIDSRTRLAGNNSVIDNLFINISHRFPNVSGNGKSEIINNVIYNYLHRLTSVFNESKVNIIGNYYKGGATSYANYGGNFQLATYLDGSSFNSPKAYINNNAIKDDFHNINGGDDNWNNVVWWHQWDKTSKDFNREDFEMDKMADLGPLSIVSPEESFASVTNNVGANKTLEANGVKNNYLDEVDSMYLRDVTNGGRESIDPSSSYAYRDTTNRSQLIYPEIPAKERDEAYDTDKDGMPNLWEEAMGLDPNSDDSGLDKDGDGYTNIEEFINLIDL